MENRTDIYLNGEWVKPHGSETLEVVDPRTAQVVATVVLADEQDVDAAVSAARKAFNRNDWPVEERLAALTKLAEIFVERTDEMAACVSSEMGAPDAASKAIQVGMPLQVLNTTIKVLRDFEFDTPLGPSTIAKEPVGVAAAITPWNFPLHQAMAKVSSALAAGCPVILKPAELTPLSAYLFAQAIHDAGVPAGWFALLPGRGTVVGAALASHPGVDIVSFTGSTKVGREISRLGAESIKRVTLELGGKSPSVLLDDLDDEAFENAVKTSFGFCLMNTGQTCAAWTRMIIPENRYDDAVRILRELAPTLAPNLGPLASAQQWDRVRGYLDTGLAEGAVLEVGEIEDAPVDGYWMTPKVLGKVSPDMTIGQEEIFGPVLALQTYTTVDEAVELANSTIYGLSAGVFGADEDRAWEVARRIRSGVVHINGMNSNALAPFGGFKQSGIGRELGEFGIEEYLEIKSLQPRPVAAS